jgi:hypothetical protein
MCPDIVQTTLLKEREREWKPDPQVINKWTVLYNLQKDYMNRILPNVNSIKDYDKVMHEKLLKEKAERENLSALRQFQEKVNRDLASNKDNTKFDTDNPECDDIEYSRNKVVAANTDIKSSSNSENSLFNNNIIDNVRLNNKVEPTNKLNILNQNVLKNSVSSFMKRNEFKFKQNGDVENDEIIDFTKESDMNNFDVNNMISKIKLLPGQKVEYLGSSIGDIKKVKVKPKNQDKKEIEGLKKEINNLEKKLKDDKQQSKQFSSEMINSLKNEIQNIKNQEIENTKRYEAQIDKLKNSTTVFNNINNHIEPRFNQANKKESMKTKIVNTLSKPKDNFANPPMIRSDNKQPTSESTEDDFFSQMDSRISNPPSSLLEQSIVTYDKNLFDTLIKKSENYNLETQRRGRRRSRFPDPQWDCAEAQIAKLVRYLCEEEVSVSYQKYCKPIFEQINTMIESYLYHDNNLEICQNLHMCPVTVDL